MGLSKPTKPNGFLGTDATFLRNGAGLDGKPCNTMPLHNFYATHTAPSAAHSG